MHGKTEKRSAGIPVTDSKRKMALSRLRKKDMAPAMNILPTEACRKEKRLFARCASLHGMARTADAAILAHLEQLRLEVNEKGAYDLSPLRKHLCDVPSRDLRARERAHPSP